MTKGWKSKVIDGYFVAWCIRSDDCDYRRRLKNTFKNRKSVNAMMQGHGNKHSMRTRTSKAEMKNKLGLLYWEELQ